MPTGMFEYRDEGERRAIERAIAFVAEMRDLAHTAPCGQVLGLCETQAVKRGLVEGTIKERVNLRLKRTGAPWLAPRVGSFVERLALSDGPEWTEYWATQAA